MAGNNGERRPAGHEERDVNVWAVGKFDVALAMLCIVAFVLLFGLFRYFQNRERVESPAGEAAAVPGLPPEPRLQESPVRDLKQMRDSEDQILGSYGWVDRQKGIVRLPIGRAIDLLAQRGLPARPGNGPESAASGVSVPTESGLGPKMLPPGGPLAGDLGSK
jgi:hypothetical protein